MPLSLVAFAAATAFAPLSSGPAVAPAGVRALSPVMSANRKVYSFDNEGVFEAREVSIKRPPCACKRTKPSRRAPSAPVPPPMIQQPQCICCPAPAFPLRHRVFLLSAVEELRVATGVADAGLLSAAEDAGVFSKLESAGAFSLVEKALPIVEDLRLLTTFEKLLNVDWALQFTAAGFILVSFPALFTLQICGFVPTASGPAVALEAAFALATLTFGGAGIVTALLISKLQLAKD